MTSKPDSFEDLLHSSSRALVVGVGGGGDVAGALVTARFLEFCGLSFVLGGLSWERAVYDPLPGPRAFHEAKNVRALHPYVWFANAESRTQTGVYFAESRMAACLQEEVLLIDINGGTKGVVEGLTVALEMLNIDLLVGVDVGGDSLAWGNEPGLRSPLADSIMLAAFNELELQGRRTLWGIFGYGSDGELSVEEIEFALAKLAGSRALLGAWSLTPRIAAELEKVIETVPTEASAVPIRCFQGAWGETKIRRDQRPVKLTPLAALTFFVSTGKLFETLARPAQAVSGSSSLDEANEALHRIAIKTELDLEREWYAAENK